MKKLNYLVVLLDDVSISYCYYDVNKNKTRLISLDILKECIFYAMKENLSLQFIYPDYDLPKDYVNVIETIDHIKIMSVNNPNYQIADVLVINSLEETNSIILRKDVPYVLRLTKKELLDGESIIFEILSNVTYLNIIIKDIPSLYDKEISLFKGLLNRLSLFAEKTYVEGSPILTNILTDRIILSKMNNCDAGYTNITIAPNGSFYVCPAFYYESEDDNVGNLLNGLSIKNSQLYQIKNAPICSHCDAFQCKRCVWLNRKTTLEINTPSHEQCVFEHIVRNTSRVFLNNLRKYGDFFPDHDDIKEIDYLDPFEKYNYWK